MKHGSLFSGIGGFDYAAEMMGWINVFHCEIEPFPRKVLKYYWPNAISYEDIRETDFTIHRGKIDILSGGFPCQPYSVAGNRKGKEDDRHLWPEMLRAIRELTPSWIVGENVPGIISWNGGLVFEEVCIDLENEGYEVQPIVLPAAAVGAPHKRDRVWFVAKDASYSTSYGSYDESSEENIKNRQNNKQSRERWIGATKGLSDEQYASNSDSIKRPKRRCDAERSTSTKRHVGLCDSWADGGAWQDFPTQPPVCGGDDGLPSELDGITFSKWRNESIKGYGNAVVPQVVVEIFKVIEEMNNQ